MEAALQRAIEQIDRLVDLVHAVRGGRTAVGAGDDLATVLHLLIGDGPGQGLLALAYNELGLDPPRIPAWGQGMPRSQPQPDASQPDLPVALGIRSLFTRTEDDEAKFIWLALPDLLDEACVFSCAPGPSPHGEWSWRKLIELARHKYGAHAGQRPPQWLRDLRYYPTSGTTALTLMLWTIGEGIAIATTNHLAKHGVEVDSYSPPTKYLGGVELESAYICGTGASFSVDAHCRFGGEHRGARDILGAVAGGKPVIMSLTPDGRFETRVGCDGQSLDELERVAQRGPNRKARRAAASRDRRQRE